LSFPSATSIDHKLSTSCVLNRKLHLSFRMITTPMVWR